MDLNKPPCRKAKDIRRERRETKLAKRAQEAQGRGESPMEIPLNKVKNTAKTLEDFLNEPLPENPAHTLEVCTFLNRFCIFSYLYLLISVSPLLVYKCLLWKYLLNMNNIHFIW